MAFNPGVPPAWVSGGVTNDGSTRKFYRAVEQLRKEGKDITEAAVKELYIKFGGLLIEEPIVDDLEADEDFTPVIRRGRRAKVEEAE